MAETDLRIIKTRRGTTGAESGPCRGADDMLRCPDIRLRLNSFQSGEKRAGASSAELRGRKMSVGGDIVFGFTGKRF